MGRLKYFELTLRSSSSQSSYPDQGTLASKSEMNVNRIYNEIRLLKYGHRQAVCPDKINGGKL